MGFFILYCLLYWVLHILVLCHGTMVCHGFLFWLLQTYGDDGGTVLLWGLFITWSMMDIMTMVKYVLDGTLMINIAVSDEYGLLDSDLPKFIRNCGLASQAYQNLLSLCYKWICIIA
jgi:hypothetical protein